MGRKKLKIKQSGYFRFRILPELKKQFLNYCKKNKLIPSKVLKEVIEEKIK